MGEQRVLKPLGVGRGFLGECILLAGAKVLGCLICIRRTPRYSQTQGERKFNLDTRLYDLPEGEMVGVQGYTLWNMQPQGRGECSYSRLAQVVCAHAHAECA